MVDIITGYSILNKQLLQVAKEMNVLSQIVLKEKPIQVQVKEVPYTISDKFERLGPTVVAHDLSQYINRFHSIRLDSEETCMLDDLCDFNTDDIDLSWVLEVK